MKRKTKRIVKAWLDFLGCIATVAIMVAVFGFALHHGAIWNSKANCNTATRQLVFYEQCIDAELCNLTYREHQRYKAYLSMRARDCPIN